MATNSGKAYAKAWAKYYHDAGHSDAFSGYNKYNYNTPWGDSDFTDSSNYLNNLGGGLNWLGEQNNESAYRDWETDRKSTRLNSSHSAKSRMPSSA